MQKLPEREKSKRMASLRLTLPFLKPYIKELSFASLALIFTSGITLLIGQGLKLIVDTGFSKGDADLLNKSVLLFIGILLFLALGTFVRFYLVTWVGERVTADIRLAVFNKVIMLHPGFFELNESREIQTRITADTAILQTVVGASVSIAFRNILILTGGAVFLFITNTRLTLIAVFCIPLVLLPLFFFGRRVRKLSRATQDEYAKMGAYVGESLQSIKTVHASNHQGTDKKRFQSLVESAFGKAVQQTRQRAFLMTTVIFLVFGSIAGMFWSGGHDVLSGRITSGELLAFVFYAMMIGSAVGALSEVVSDLQKAAGAAERLMELLHAENKIVSPETSHSPGKKNHSCISLKNVTFAYDTRKDQPALRGITLTINPGETLALVGPSGAGKTTLFDLLLRFYDPQQGSILFDDQPISQLDLEEYRTQLAIVPQNPTLFSATVAENISYSHPLATHEMIKQAAREAYAHDFIKELPEGYDTYLGESGSQLSGGQRQRLTIARALLRDPAILLLDEATNSLDAESEDIVQKAITALMKNRTTVIIAHRLATVRNADRIAVMEQGVIVAIGTHQTLLKSCPLYKRLATLQFRE